MLDINYKTIKQYIIDNGINDLREYHSRYHSKKLPSNFPSGIINYLKKHDRANFISTDDLFPCAYEKSKKTVVKSPKQPKVKKTPKVYVKQPKYTFEEALKYARLLGFHSQTEWAEYCKQNKNSWDKLMPKSPHMFYKNSGWVSWKHFLIGDNVPIKMSQGEREIFNILQSENIYFEMNKKYPDLKNGKLSFDFFIPSHNQLIEFDGIYHFEAIHGNKEQFQKTIKNDLMKNQYAYNNNIKLRRIAYYEDAYIAQILFDIGLTSTPNHKRLAYNKYKTNKFKGTPKNYKYFATSGAYTYDDIHEIRQHYLSGLTRTEINKALNINLTTHVYRDMVSNKTYFNPNYDKRKRIVIPKIPKQPKAPVRDPILVAELALAKSNHEKLKNNIELEIQEFKKKIKFYNKKKNEIPVLENKRNTLVLDVKINKDNFGEFGTYKHYGRYTYENFVFKSKDVKGEITCRVHGGFYQTPHNHLSVNKSAQCPKCAMENKGFPENLPWRDIRNIRTYSNKTISVKRRNVTLFNELNNTISKLNIELFKFKQDSNDLIDKSNMEIDRLKLLINPNFISKIKTNPIPIPIKRDESITLPNYNYNQKGVANVRKLLYDDYVFIIENQQLGCNILGKKYSIDPSTIKKIRRFETYKPFARQYRESKNLIN